MMTQLAEDYIPNSLQQKLRTQALLVWVVTTGIVLVWVGSIVAAPLLAPSSISSALNTFFSYICHQIPERSLYLAGHQMAVCTRCFGVYFGLFAGIAVYPLWRGVDNVEPISRIWLFASLVPITIDWSLTLFGFWENTHFSRFVTGLILGFACAVFIVPAVVDIKRNLSRTNRRAST